MAFEKGNQLGKNAGGGRKGYELEKEQLDKMRRILNKDLDFIERLQEGTIDDKALKAMQLAQARILKILDKLHASKTDVTTDGEKIEVIPIYGGLSKHNLDAKDIPTDQEN